jgi:hypothetical protein
VKVNRSLGRRRPGDLAIEGAQPDPANEGASRIPHARDAPFVKLANVDQIADTPPLRRGLKPVEPVERHR